MSSVLARLTDAQNAHDAEQMASCFTDDYRSAQPCHPGREFTGSAQVLANWAAVFAGVPDFHAEMVGFCRHGDTEWGEFDWEGNHVDGSPFTMRGVVIAIIDDGQIAQARLYMEPVERTAEDIDTAVEHLYRPASAPE